MATADGLSRVQELRTDTPERWRALVQMLREFMGAHGVSPHVHSCNDEERTLAAWVSLVRQWASPLLQDEVNGMLWHNVPATEFGSSDTAPLPRSWLTRLLMVKKCPCQKRLKMLQGKQQ